MLRWWAKAVRIGGMVCLLGAALLARTGLAAPLDCDALKAEIEAKIQAQGVASYTLEIVDNADVRDPAMVVGSCAGGSRKIIYQKNGN